MIVLHTLNIEIEQLKSLIKDKIQHTYLEKYIGEPEIDENKLGILSMITDNTSLSTFKKRQYIITTMLVQIALDTHDLVPVTNSEKEGRSSKTTKQLSVLAGDYFSGLYYLLLAEIEDFDMIHILASAIKEINEYKMKLYYQKESSFQEYISTIKKIESILIIRVAEYVDNTIMNKTIGDLIITSKLIHEKRNAYNKEVSPIINNWLNRSTDSTLSSTLNIVDSVIQQKTKRIEEDLSTFPLQFSIYKTQIHYMLNELTYSNTSVAEEG